ncbi:putative Ganglioside-induced differentiation-associated protein 1 [Hypsibius exemplaris]|uniref:Ganglioside-induced differentiation-associated protein 1 n=1 Tax=Hypsibius exemplaris TaxID=2072580 RepID=A0A1W0WPW3_HYPEX|nr:putative Ganglioside-induced differentiation-associated protein 1 [Hypsibius exemplaris]
MARPEAVNPGKAPVVLYYYPLSYYSQKVRMALLEKGIPHSLEFIDIVTGENYEPWFVQINPACEVPVLRHGTKIVSGSQKIVDYLEDNFIQGFTQLQPADRAGLEFHKCRYLREAIDEVPVEFITYGYFRHAELLEKIKVPDFVRKHLGDRFFQRQTQLARQIQKHPELRASYTAKLRRVEANDEKVDDIHAINGALNEVEAILDKIEEHLRMNTSVAARKDWWLCSAEFTIADISLAILLSRLYFLGLAQRFWSIATRPYLAIYYQRLNDRASYQKVAITHITTGDLISLGGSSLLLSYGLPALGVATVVGALTLAAVLFLKRRK